MALDYTVLFTDIGILIKKLNTYNTMAATTFPTDRDAIDTEMANFLAVTSKLSGMYTSAQNALVSLRANLAGLVTVRLQDVPTVVSQLSLIQTSIAGILQALYRQMGLDSESVDQSTVTLGSVSYAAANVGNAVLYVSKVLDGVTPPGAGMAANPLYNGVDSELCVPSETMVVECVADSEIDHLTEGGERWTIRGGPSYPKLSYQTEGSGQGPSFNCLDNESLLANSGLESWSTNTPNSWTVSSGAAGITKESTTIYRGTYALKFAGNASLVLGLTQAVSPSRLTARKRYLLSFAFKASGVPAVGAVTVKFTGTGYTAAGSEQITIAAASFPTSWTRYQCWVNLPVSIPSDWALSVALSGPLSNGTNVFFDSFVFAPARYHGGVCFGLVAGAVNSLRGDRATFTVANDQAGVFQDFFRRWYGFQLVSAGGGAETIADSLAS